MHRGTRWVSVVMILGALLVLTACSGGTTSGTGGTSGGGTKGSTSGTATITLKNMQFSPDTLDVAVGTKVTVVNSDSVPHHIVIGTDDLGETAPGETTSWTAPSDGVYMMKCLIHPSMSGQITVGAGGSTIGTPASGSTGGTGY